MGVWSLRRRREPYRAIETEYAPPPPTVPSIYRDGTYLISEFGEARTWAVHRRGRWGVVYEFLGAQPVAGWVADEQIPLEIRALALHRAMDEWQ
jgi:hypothetical protein